MLFTLRYTDSRHSLELGHTHPRYHHHLHQAAGCYICWGSCHTPANPIIIYIICGVIRTIITGIAKAIMICISLSRIRNIGAIIPEVRDAITVSVWGEALLLALYPGASTATWR